MEKLKIKAEIRRMAYSRVVWDRLVSRNLILASGLLSLNGSMTEYLKTDIVSYGFPSICFLVANGPHARMPACVAC